MQGKQARIAGKTLFKSLFVQKNPTHNQALTAGENLLKRSIVRKYVEIYYQASIIKIVWHWHIKRGKDQWQGIENAEIDTVAHENIISGEYEISNQWRKSISFSKWQAIIEELQRII